MFKMSALVGFIFFELYKFQIYLFIRVCDLHVSQFTKHIQELPYSPQYSAGSVLNAAHAGNHINAPENLKNLELRYYE
jgi:hypothetical protein